MILSLYVIGSAFGLLVLWHLLRNARRELWEVTQERDTWVRSAQALQAPHPGYDVVPATVVRHAEGPEQ